MNDQVLTDDEKDALIDGVENGDVEVQSSEGPHYASVEAFEVAPRNRIVSNSYPRLQNINRKLAEYIGKSVSAVLNDKVEVEAGMLDTSAWGEFVEQATETAMLFEFSALPLDGSAVIHIQASGVRHLVEAFYCGSKDNPPRHEIDGFTPGEINAMTLVCNEILGGIAETWRSLTSLEPEKVAVHASTDIVEVIDSNSVVIFSEFVLHHGEDQLPFHIAWPTQMLAPLLPVLEGAKHDRDAQKDLHWQQVIRARVPEAQVKVSSCVGSAIMNLRAVAALEPGDIIDIENPRKGTVFAKHVPVLEGRFGVHDGCYAIEATRWLADVNAAEETAEQA